MLYGVTTTQLNQQVQRNLDRFPRDFMFQLTAKEHAALMLQNATSKLGRGGRRKLPFVCTICVHAFVTKSSVDNGLGTSNLSP
jgi:hypothetical protein